MKNSVAIDKNYTTKPFFKKIVLFTIPLMLGNVLQLLYSVADTVVLSNFGVENAAGAVSITGSVTGLITNVFMGLSTGSCVLFAKYLGEKNGEKASRTVHTALATGLTFGFLIGITGFFISGSILKLMSTTEEYFSLSKIYLKIVFLGMPALFVYNYSASILLGVGDSKRPFIFSATSGAINVSFNLLFVLVLKMDTVGVALATVISQYYMATLAVISLLRRKDCGKLYIKKIRFYKEQFKSMIKIGVPNGIQSAFFSFSDMIVQSGINRSLKNGVGGFTTEVVNGCSYSGYIGGFIYVAMRSVYTATVTFTGQNYGARKADNVKSVLRNCIGIVLMYSLTLGVLAAIFANKILFIYTRDAATIAAGAYRMRVVLPFHFILGIMDVFIGFFHGMGKAAIPMIVSTLLCCVVRILYIYTVFDWFTGVLTLYVMYPITHFLTLVVLLIYYLFIERKKLNEIEEKEKLKQERTEEAEVSA